MNGQTDYYMCPFCVCSWVCNGPHIEEKDAGKFYYRINLIREDVAEFSRELIIKYGDALSKEELADLVEFRIINRGAI